MIKASSWRFLLTAIPALALGVSLSACGDDKSTSETDDGTTAGGETTEDGSSTTRSTTDDSTTSGNTTAGPTTDPSTSGPTTDPVTTDPTTDPSTTGEPIMVTAFRWDTMKIEDPHFFALNCFLDITDQVNPLLQTAVGTDDDGDGSLDLNFVMLFPDPLDQKPPGGDMDFALADECIPPVDKAFCSLGAGTVENSTFANADMCLAPDPAHLNYGLPTSPVPGPCFTSGQLPMLVLDIGGFQLPLRDVEVSATYDGDPANGLVNGLMRGFLTQEDGENTVLPEDIMVVGGMAIADLVCKGDDLDDNNGTPGWWFYVTFTAKGAVWLG